MPYEGHHGTLHHLNHPGPWDDPPTQTVMRDVPPGVEMVKITKVVGINSPVAWLRPGVEGASEGMDGWCVDGARCQVWLGY